MDPEPSSETFRSFKLVNLRSIGISKKPVAISIAGNHGGQVVITG
jgi:hypothetical protein